MIPPLDYTPMGLRKNFQHGDRFIHSSHDKVRLQQYYQLSQPEYTPKDSLLTKELYSLSREIYKARLSEVFSVPETPSAPWSKLWPVRHRNNPCIRSCSVVLEVPEMSTNACEHLLDWGYNGQLIIALPSVIYLWNTATDQSIQFSTSKTTCVKWNNEGTEFFLSYKSGKFKVVDFLTGNTKCERFTTCHVNCYVTAIAFNPSRCFFIVGCSKGYFTIYDNKEKVSKIGTITAHNNSITTLSFSCDGSQLAVAFLDTLVKIYEVDTYRHLLNIHTEAPSRTLSWHPWKKTCIVIGDLTGMIFVVDTKYPNEHMLGMYVPTLQSSIECLSFNPVTAELAVSQKLMLEYPENPEVYIEKTKLHVLASLDRVVDRMQSVSGRVTYMCWSPDGSKIAAVCGSDHCLKIWDFLPHSEKRRVKRVTPESVYESMYLDLTRRLNMVLR